MREPRRLQDAGVERMLDRGQTYELPDVIASGFVSAGVADPVARPDLVDEMHERRDRRPPENAALAGPPEQKRRRR